MSAKREIADVLKQWLQLTRAEGAAIESAAWPAVRQIQAQKAVLQKSLAEAARKCAEEAGPDSAVNSALVPFRGEVGRILSLLTRNSAALSEKLRQARARLGTLDETRRNLRKIQRSYFRPKRPTAWQSYS